MIRKLALFVTLVAMMCFGVTALQAQWNFVKVFPDANFNHGGLNNAITVDRLGRVWIASVGATDSVPTLNNLSVYKKTGRISVFSPDGSTQAAFSPIRVYLSNDGTTINDTVPTGTSYGMQKDPDGNVLVELASSRIYRLDYKTGKALGRAIAPIPNYASSLASLSVDDLGEIFLVPVIGGPGPAAISGDFSGSVVVLETVDSSAYGGIARNIAVSADGNDVYVPYFTGFQIITGPDTSTGPVVLHYHSGFGTGTAYALKDTLFRGMSVESMAWQPGTGYLWCGSGGPVTDKNTDTTKSPLTWYAYDMTNRSKPVLKDSLKYSFTGAGISADSAKITIIDERGIAFSPTGDTVYVGVFNSAKNCIQMFKKGPTGVKQEANVVVRQYELMQNYPNPFNPSTDIRFTLSNAGYTTLKVYDVLGREISTLVNERLNTGAYSVTFDARNIPSGTYFYTLNVDGNQISKKMMLLK